MNLDLRAQKIIDAQSILFGEESAISGVFSTSTRKKRSAQILLAVAGLRPEDPWQFAHFFGDGTDYSIRTREIIHFLNDHYGESISLGSYDTIRRGFLVHLMSAGFIVPSKPEAHQSDGTRGYAISPLAGKLLRAFGTSDWDNELNAFRASTPAQEEGDAEVERVSVSIVTQGEHKFYTCTISSEILAKCCFVSTREEDPISGFQRLLDKKRAEDIARYIDHGLGTVPSSIILSAQEDAHLRDVAQGKTIEFRVTPRSFLILDGQHRVYGFMLAQSRLRVPVVIYQGLSRRDETRLFIDINSKQKGVPNELLFDIKKLAEYENSTEERLREVFDLFHNSSDSSLLGITSPSARERGKISRTTFNLAAKPLLVPFEEKTPGEFYDVLNSYLIAFKEGMATLSKEEYFPNNIIFRAAMSFFPFVASKAKDRFGPRYTTEDFWIVLQPLFRNIKPSKFINPGNSIEKLTADFVEYYKADFRL